MISHNHAELFHVLSKNRHLRSHKLVPNIYGRQHLVVIPQFPVEHLDAFVAARVDLMDGREALRRLVYKLKGERDGTALAFLKDETSMNLVSFL